MPAPALEAAPVELEIKVPGGGGPGAAGPEDPGRGDGGGGDDDEPRRFQLYRLGLTLALISIGTLFFALAMIYYSRSRTPRYWQPIQTPVVLWLSTGILALSSLMIESARRALAGHRWFVYRRRLMLTTFLGLSFIASQLIALSELVRRGYYVRSNPHASVFYVFTGLHAAHLLVGMMVLLYLLFRRGKNWNRHRMISGLIAVYWHFMGLVWVALFAILALL